MSGNSETNDFKTLIGKVADGNPLNPDEARAAFEIMMSGEATPSQTGGFLMALRVRGETVDEITAGAMVMREKAMAVDAPANAIDIVGTGGDGTGTYNISTCSALVVAGCGAPVAKHGNKALSSKAGAADVLTALGIEMELTPQGIARCVREAGIGFMMAPRHHGAMRHVGPTRVELGTRTVFNLLGPLSNPAHVKRQMVGVFAPEWVEPLAHVFRKLGLDAAWVVHGDGMDELTTTGTTHVAELKNGKVTTFDIEPEDAGLARAALADLKGGTSEENAVALRAVLDGEPGPYRDVVLLNSAASLIVAGKVGDLKAGVAFAEESIDSGKAKTALADLIWISRQEAAA